MAKLNKGRYTADLGDRNDIVVFIIGMRINQLWKVWKWLPVAVAMPKMIMELAKDRSLGLLGTPRTMVSGRVITVLQYWNSFEDLERYSRSGELKHLPAWRWFNRKVRDNGSVGIWHETYCVPRGAVETVYGNMPPFGLGAATSLVPATSARVSAAKRLGREDAGQPVEPY
jgi:hypothetical protein